jgi:endogenous inhibitor of DNA gyrase (YacG/DUF329 family)
MKTCIRCDAKFETDSKHANRKYCSDRCRKLYWEMLKRPIVACLCCGKSFRVYRGRKKYCSDGCQERQRSRNRAAARREGKKKCKQCGRWFTPAEKQQTRQLFCSARCKDRERQKRRVDIQPGVVVEWEYRGTWRASHLPRIALRGVVVERPPGRIAHVFCAGVTHEVQAFRLRLI